MPGHGMTVHDREEIRGEQRGAMSLDRQREAASLAIAGRDAGWALEQLTDEEFDHLLELDRKKEERVRKLITNRLTAGVHYGTVPGIQKPFAWEPTADEILKLFRWDCRPIGEPTVHRATDYVEATVTVGVFNLRGNQVGASAMRSCGTLERRFKNQKSGKWKFDDPREAVNECVSMAFKRAKVAATLGAAGAKHFFANPELLEAGEEAAETAAAEPVDLLSEEELKPILVAARKAGIPTAAAFRDFITRHLGHAYVTKADVEPLRQHIANERAARAGQQVKDGAQGYGEDQAPASGTGQSATVQEPSDIEVDQQLAAEESRSG